MHVPRYVLGRNCMPWMYCTYMDPVSTPPYFVNQFLTLKFYCLDTRWDRIHHFECKFWAELVLFCNWKEKVSKDCLLSFKFILEKKVFFFNRILREKVWKAITIFLAFTSDVLNWNLSPIYFLEKTIYFICLFQKVTRQFK